MRGSDSYSESLFSTVRLDDFVPAMNPLRPIRTGMKKAFAKLDGHDLGRHHAANGSQRGAARLSLNVS